MNGALPAVVPDNAAYFHAAYIAAAVIYGGYIALLWARARALRARARGR
jgi:hypothetical protein